MTVTAHSAVGARVHKWLGDLPVEWSGARLFEVADAWTSNVDKHSVDGQAPVLLCNYVDVYKNESIVDSLDFMAATATREQIKRFRIRTGDTLITKDSETADDIGVPAFVEHEADNLICGYHLAIVRPDPGRVVPKFLFWALRSEPIARQWAVLASGVTRVGIRSTDLNKITIPLPSADEQRDIADFLDHETAQIDALVAKQEEFIALLQLRRSAVINASVAPEEGSLQCVRLKYMLVGVDQGVSPQAENAVVEGDAWGVLKAGCVNRGIFRQSEHKRLPADFAVDPRIAVRAGDLIVSRANGTPSLVGSAAIVEDIDHRLILSDKLFRLVPRDGVDSRFLAWSLNTRSYRAQVAAAISGAEGLANNLPLSALRMFRFYLPDLATQRRLVRQVDEQTAAIDGLIAKAQEHIALAKERRAALITAAVTGQFDVRTAPKVG